MRKTATDILSLLPSALSLLLLFYLLPLRDACFSLLAVTVHEWGHIAAAAVGEGTLPRFRGQRGGFLLAADMPTAGGLLLYAMGGCLANLLFLFLALLFSLFPTFRESAYLFGAYSLLYLIFNLLPAPPLDGEKLLAYLLPRYLDGSRAKRILIFLRYTVIFGILFFSLFLSLGGGSCFYGIFLSLSLLTACPTKISFSEKKREKRRKTEKT